MSLFFSFHLSLFIAYDYWKICDKKLGEEWILRLQAQIFSREASVVLGEKDKLTAKPGEGGGCRV